MQLASAATQADSGPSALMSTFTERLEQSFALLGEFLPALFGALVILFAGYLVAKVIEKGTARLLRRMHLNQLLERGGRAGDRLALRHGRQLYGRRPLHERVQCRCFGTHGLRRLDQ